MILSQGISLTVILMFAVFNFFHFPYQQGTFLSSNSILFLSSCKHQHWCGSFFLESNFTFSLTIHKEEPHKEEEMENRSFQFAPQKWALGVWGELKFIKHFFVLLHGLCEKCFLIPWINFAREQQLVPSTLDVPYFRMLRVGRLMVVNETYFIILLPILSRFTQKILSSKNAKSSHENIKLILKVERLHDVLRKKKDMLIDEQYFHHLIFFSLHAVMNNWTEGKEQRRMR